MVKIWIQEKPVIVRSKRKNRKLCEQKHRSERSRKMTNKEYRQDPGISRSDLFEMR